MHLDHAHKSKALTASLIVAFIFMCIEIGFGFWAHSLALISDGLHLFTDVGAFLISIFALHIAKRSPSEKMSYGYKRSEVFGAMINSAFLLVLICFLIVESIDRFYNQEVVDGKIVFVVAFIGLLANFFMLYLLRNGRQDLNMKAAYLHVLGDLLGSVGVLIAGALIWAFKWYVFDSIMTLVISIIIFRSAYHIIKEAALILLEAVPKDVNLAQIKLALQNIHGVDEVHDLHVWAIDQRLYALSCHLVAKKSVLNEANQILKEQFQIEHTTIQIETKGEFDPKHCVDCHNGK